MAINNVNLNTVAPTNTVAPAQNTTNNSNVPQTSPVTTAVLTGLTCLAIYSIAGLAKGKFNSHLNLKYCKELAQNAPEILQKAKNEAGDLHKLITSLFDEAQEQSVKVGQNGFLIKNSEGIKFFEELNETFNKNADIICEYKNGKPISIMSGLKEEITKNPAKKASEAIEQEEEIITRHFKEMLDLRNDNETKLLKDGIFVPKNQNSPDTTRASQIFDFNEESQIKSFGTNYTKRGDTKTFGIRTKCNEDELPIRVEFDSDYTPEKTIMTELYELKENGKWQRQ